MTAETRQTCAWGPILYVAGSVAGILSIAVAFFNIAQHPEVKYTWTALLLGFSHLLKVRYYVDKPVALWINVVSAVGWFGVCLVSTAAR